MSTARILIKQGAAVYRFLLFETSADGSLLVFLDRAARPSRGGMTLDETGAFVPEQSQTDQPSSSTKFSIHTTGEVHRYLGGQRKSTIHIEPLYALTGVNGVGFVSIPRISRLDPRDLNKHIHDIAATLEFPEEVLERVSFAIEIGPKPQVPQTFGVALDYEVYSAVVTVTSLTFSLDLADHFICGMSKTGRFEQRQMDKASAELAFHQAAHPHSPPIFREESGAYVALAATPMRASPNLKIIFDRKDLRTEQIPFGHLSQPTHKVRFWICDSGGRNKRNDLRKHITSITLSAEL